jgi:hypothetical protein
VSAGAAGQGTAVGTEVKTQSATPTAAATVAGSDLSLAVAGTTADVAGTTAGATAGTDQAAVDATALTPAPGTQVLGETLSRPSALARTGAGIGAMALVGGLLCGGGRLALLARRLLRIG